MKHTLRAFRHRNYRLFFCGQSLSIMGNWIQQIAMAWLVYRLTGSAWLLGVTGFAGQIAVFLFAPFGGLWADRFDRRKLLIITQTAAAWSGLPSAGCCSQRRVKRSAFSSTVSRNWRSSPRS